MNRLAKKSNITINWKCNVTSWKKWRIKKTKTEYKFNFNENLNFLIENLIYRNKFHFIPTSSSISFSSVSRKPHKSKHKNYEKFYGSWYLVWRMIYYSGKNEKIKQPSISTICSLLVETLIWKLMYWLDRIFCFLSLFSFGVNSVCISYEYVIKKNREAFAMR